MLCKGMSNVFRLANDGDILILSVGMGSYYLSEINTRSRNLSTKSMICTDLSKMGASLLAWGISTALVKNDMSWFINAETGEVFFQFLPPNHFPKALCISHEFIGTATSVIIAKLLEKMLESNDVAFVQCLQKNIDQVGSVAAAAEALERVYHDKSVAQPCIDFDSHELCSAPGVPLSEASPELRDLICVSTRPSLKPLADARKEDVYEFLNGFRVLTTTGLKPVPEERTPKACFKKLGYLSTTDDPVRLFLGIEKECTNVAEALYTALHTDCYEGIKDILKGAEIAVLVRTVASFTGSLLLQPNSCLSAMRMAPDPRDRCTPRRSHELASTRMEMHAGWESGDLIWWLGRRPTDRPLLPTDCHHGAHRLNSGERWRLWGAHLLRGGHEPTARPPV